MSSQETKSSQCKEKVSAAAATPQELAAHPLAASGGQSPLSAASDGEMDHAGPRNPQRGQGLLVHPSLQAMTSLPDRYRYLEVSSRFGGVGSGGA
jgi:hypothetical protein